MLGGAIPPARLRPVPAKLVWPVRIFWGLCLIFSIFAQVGGIWRGHVNAVTADPRFAAVGLEAVVPQGDLGFDVVPTDPATAAAGVPEQAKIVAIDGAAIRETEDVAPVSERLAGPPGTPVRLTLQTYEGTLHQVTLRRGPIEGAAAVNARRVAFWSSTGAWLIGVAVLVFAAVMLMLRRPRDPVSLLLSLSFLFAVSYVRAPLDFYAWIEMEWLGSVLPSVWLGLLLVVLPAFPDGRFVPRWSGWLAVLAIPFVCVIVLDSVSDAMTAIVALAGAAASTIAPLIRYRRTPPGLERQQLKWAALGFATSIALLFGAYGLFLLEEARLTPAGAEGVLDFVKAVALHLSFVLLPLGVLVSLLRYRLWDVDHFIGRSSAFGIVTLILGGGWAAMQEAVKIGLTGVSDQIDPTTIAAISTGVVAILFPPLQARVERWTERRLQEPIARLRALSEQWAALGQVAAPEALAEAAFRDILTAAAATGGDLWLAEDGTWRRIAAAGPGESFPPIDAVGEEALAAIPYTLDARVAQLRLAPRPDGTGYPGDMRRALDGLGDPLASALETAIERAHHRKAMAAITDRLDRLEARLEGSGR